MTTKPGYWLETDADRKMIEAHHAEVKQMREASEDDGA